ncbi:MAG: HPr-rel-A system PqqD family peptide chaperone [Thiobacillus sp.]
MRFQLKEYDNEAVVFDTASGDTHLLAPLTLTVFNTVARNPGLSGTDLQSSVATQLALSTNTQLPAMVDDALDRLHQIGLLSTR